MLTTILLYIVFGALAAVIIAQQRTILAYQRDRRAAIEALDGSIAMARSLSKEARALTSAEQGGAP